MSMPEWTYTLPVPPPGGRLHEAWMTSFEEPDAELLVEHFLPSLLGTSHSLSQERQERTLFFGELGTALEQTHGRMTVISSPPRVAREPSQYPWLWRYVDLFRVGAVGRAVQHAKLWAFHWKTGDTERLDLYVSSTNLTASAFKGQVQAGWQASLRLSERSTATARRTWGELVPFLDALGLSAGAIATDRLQRLISLLGRAECPTEVKFVASIPGSKSAARQLKQFDLSKMHILTPTIGEWTSQAVDTWSSECGVAPEKIYLKWIATSHPWAEKSGWSLTSASGKVLEASGVRVECLPAKARFADLHRQADSRWSHAKIYLLHSRKQRRLLLTSANWSVAAWGAGRATPRNFELGVVFAADWAVLESLGEPFDPPATVPFYVDRSEDDENASFLEWVEARWDGQLLHLVARSLDSATAITAVIAFYGGADIMVPLIEAAGTLPWTDHIHTPLVARFTQGQETLDVEVLDLRRPEKFSDTPLPEVDLALAEALRAAFLLQRYGGPIADADSIPGLGELHRQLAAALPTDYTVPAWIAARTAFGVVDSWNAACNAAKDDPLTLQQVRLDGEELRKIYAHRGGPADRLAAEELQWRIEGKV